MQTSTELENDWCPHVCNVRRQHYKYVAVLMVMHMYTNVNVYATDLSNV